MLALFSRSLRLFRVVYASTSCSRNRSYSLILSQLMRLNAFSFMYVFAIGSHAFFSIGARKASSCFTHVSTSMPSTNLSGLLQRFIGNDCTLSSGAIVGVFVFALLQICIFVVAVTGVCAVAFAALLSLSLDNRSLLVGLPCLSIVRSFIASQKIMIHTPSSMCALKPSISHRTLLTTMVNHISMLLMIRMLNVSGSSGTFSS